MKKFLIFVLFFFYFMSTDFFAQRPADKFERRVYHFDNDSIQYRLFVPNDSTNLSSYPLILTFHGSGEIGIDNKIHITEWRIAETWAEDSAQAKNPTFIFSPQIPPRPNLLNYYLNQWIPGITSILDSLISEFPIDTSRIYVTGLSLGAFETWDYIYKFLPNRFAAAIPMSGGWDWSEVPIITSTPVWAFCGALDELVTGVRQTISYLESAGYRVQKKYTKYGDVGETIDEINLLNQNDKNHIYTEFTDGTHTVWSKTYDDPVVHYWLFSQKKDTVWVNIKTQVLSWEAFPKYIPLEEDTLRIISEILNPEGHLLDVNAHIQGVKSTFNDSLQLYDDGLHDDGTPSDNIFANYILLPKLEEDFFNILISATDLDDSRNIYSADMGHFTTSGPIVLDTFWVLVDHDTIVGIMDMHLQNLSKSVEIPFVSAKIISLDSSVTDIPKAQLSFNSILPNESKKTVSGWMYFYIKNNPEKLKFLLEISSNNIPYWYDTLVFQKNPTNLDVTQSNIPSAFELKQNYPNPFNPNTKISWQSPVSGRQILKVYDVLGNEVTRLINKEMEAGYHSVDFNTSDLPSGVYFYRIQIGNFVDTKKMILLK